MKSIYVRADKERRREIRTRRVQRRDSVPAAAPCDTLPLASGSTGDAADWKQSDWKPLRVTQSSRLSRHESLSQADWAVMSHSVKPTEPVRESLSQVDSTITMTLSQADWAITITLGRAITSLSIKDKYSVFSHKIIILVFGCQSIYYLSVCLCIRLTLTFYYIFQASDFGS